MYCRNVLVVETCSYERGHLFVGCFFEQKSRFFSSTINRVETLEFLVLILDPSPIAFKTLQPYCLHAHRLRRERHTPQPVYHAHTPHLQCHKPYSQDEPHPSGATAGREGPAAPAASPPSIVVFSSLPAPIAMRSEAQRALTMAHMRQASQLRPSCFWLAWARAVLSTRRVDWQSRHTRSSW